MSALPPKADIGTQPRDVRFVPKADICTAANNRQSEMDPDKSSLIREGRKASALVVTRGGRPHDLLFSVERSSVELREKYPEQEHVSLPGLFLLLAQHGTDLCRRCRSPVEGFVLTGQFSAGVK